MLRLFICILLSVSFITISCTDNPASVSADQSSRVVGSVSISEVIDHGIQFGEVRIYAGLISENGEVTMIPDQETEPDNNGHFEFQISVDEVGDSQLIIIAGANDLEFMGFLPVKFQTQNTYFIKPLNSESTIETAIWKRLKEKGESAFLRKTDIETLLNRSAASLIANNDGNMESFTNAMAAYATIRRDFIAANTTGNPSFNMAVIYTYLGIAQSGYEEILYADASENTGSLAYTELLEDKLESYASAGVSVGDLPDLAHQLQSVMQIQLVNNSSELANQVFVTQSHLSALATIRAILNPEISSHFESSVAANFRSSSDELINKFSTNDLTSDTVRQLFLEYRTNVINALELDSRIETGVITSILSEVFQQEGAAETFSDSLTDIETPDLESLTEIYKSFFSDITTIIESHADALEEINTTVLSEIIYFISLN